MLPICRTERSAKKCTIWRARHTWASDSVVAVTDRDWFNHLRLLPTSGEVNFWAPSATPFRALTPGEFFLFKLHAPDNFIVGGGVFAYANILPMLTRRECSMRRIEHRTWRRSGARIMRYRRTEADNRSDFQIGCRILTQPFFLDRRSVLMCRPAGLAISSPSRRIQQTMPTADSWDMIQKRISSSTRSAGFREEQARYGVLRAGSDAARSGIFLILVTDNYGRRCAVTGERTLPALDAAHIRPYSQGGSHEVWNGLLFRRDIHSLFDAGYVSVPPIKDLRSADASRKNLKMPPLLRSQCRSVAVPDRICQLDFNCSCLAQYERFRS